MGKHTRKRTTEATVEEAFLARVEVLPNGCWRWMLKPMRNGYGQFQFQKMSTYAHRWAYEHWVGPVPEGLELDHTCHRARACPGGVTCPHRACVNPSHLEPVTRRVNTMRGNTIAAKNAARTHCAQGHPFDKANTYYRKKGGRQCLACAAAARDKSRAKARARRDSPATP